MSDLQTFVLQRYPEYLGATPGELLLDGKRIAHTLELPWKANFRNASCIPLGKYVLAITHSTRFQKMLPLVSGVPGREGIRMHGGNTVKDLHGCIAIVTGLTIVGGEVVGIKSQDMLKDVMMIIEHYKVHSIEIREKEL